MPACGQRQVGFPLRFPFAKHFAFDFAVKNLTAKGAKKNTRKEKKENTDYQDGNDILR